MDITNMRTYSEKLRDPRWQKVRLEVFNRDEWTCTVCGDTKTTLHVHHKVYESGKDLVGEVPSRGVEKE